jgi:hypothetical protein
MMGWADCIAHWGGLLSKAVQSRLNPALEIADKSKPFEWLCKAAEGRGTDIS